MKTASRAIIDDVIETLRGIAASTDDAAVAAQLGVAGARLELLAIRIEREGEIVWSDIADQRLILVAVEQEARQLTTEPWAGLGASIARELDRVWHTPAHYPEMAVLEAENRRLRSLIDEALAAVQAVPEPLGEKRAQRLLKGLNNYLKRQAEREAPLHAPGEGLDPAAASHS